MTLQILLLFQATFHEGGFNYDDYPIELAWTLRATSSGVGGAIASEKGNMSGSPDKKTR